MFLATRAVSQSTSLGRCFRFAAWLILLGVIAGCGGGTGGDSGSQGLIGPAGGTVTSADGKVSLVIPPNAVGVTTQFAIDPDPANGGAPSPRIVGTVYSIDSDPTGISFPANALPQLTMPYPSGVADPSTLTIGTLENGQWVNVAGSQVNQANHTVTAALAHLSPYAVLQLASGTDNNPPIASVGGPYQGEVGQLIQFDAVGSIDPDRDPLTYTWRFGDGSPAVSGPQQSADHRYATAATFTVTLTVSDGRGGSDSKSTTATIVSAPPVNHQPTANAGGPYAATVGQLITFDASASTDPDQDPLTYDWNFGDGATAANAGPAPTHTYNTTSGSPFTVTVTVRDPSESFSSATATATISPLPPVNHAPAITSMMMPTPSTVIAGRSILVDGTATDADGDLLTYSWNFGDGSSSTPAISRSDATHTYNAAGPYGPYEVKLSVSDGQGGDVFDTRNLVVEAPPVNHAPVAHAGGPYVGVVGQPLAFDASASSDQDQDPLTYSWTFGDGATGDGVAVTHAYSTSAGSPFTVTVTVTDPGGLSGSASTTATITLPPNQPPIAVVNGPYAGTVGQVITFSAAGSADPDNDPATLTYNWEFGDGATGSGLSTTHAYTTAATYPVKVTVTDPAGASSSASTTAAITAPTPGNRLPVISVNVPPQALIFQQVVLSGSGSDPDGNTLSYSWNFGDGTTSAFVATASAAHQYQTAGTYTPTLTADDGHGGVVSVSGSVTVVVPAQPVAFPAQLKVYIRQNVQAPHRWHYAVPLHGSGVPPLTFSIVAFPTHQDASLPTMAMAATQYYQWLDPVTSEWRVECQSSTPAAACMATTSSSVNLATGTVVDPNTSSPIQVPSTLSPIVVYAPANCNDATWGIGQYSDAFAFTVTDGTGVTSAPATVSISFFDTGCAGGTH
ncbi:MAG TPA: PKD domain-containing protein [Nitrospiria bacterium]|nr:PKD domain-containing protein [Nitrospiria bacterium]